MVLSLSEAALFYSVAWTLLYPLSNFDERIYEKDWRIDECYVMSAGRWKF